MLPLIYIIFIVINLYSINPKIIYKKEGALLLSYRGDRILVSNKRSNIENLKSKTNADEGINEFKKINIKDECYLKKEDSDYILYLYGNKYNLNISFK